MVEYEQIILPFIVPAITGLIIFLSQWYKKGSQVEISGSDITNMKKQLESVDKNINAHLVSIDDKVDKMMQKINDLYTDIEVFKYRIRMLERALDTLTGTKTSRAPLDNGNNK